MNSTFRLQKALLFCLLGLTLSYENSLAQNNIKGIVIDASTNHPLPGAHIVIENSLAAAISNNQGEFKIPIHQSDSIRLIVSYLGFETYNKTISSSSSFLTIVLTPKVLLEDEVIITATRFGNELSGSNSMLKQEQIQIKNLGADLPILLDVLPSVVTTSDAGNGVGYTGFRVRGTDMTRINVMANGIPVNDAESHGVWWVNIPDFISSVDNIQLQRGVGTSANGAAAFGASINLQTFVPSDNPYAEISNSYGSFNTLKHSISAGSGLLKNGWNFSTRLSKISSDGFIDRAFADLKSFYTSASYYSEKNLLKINVFSGKEKTYQAWDGVPSYILDTNRTYNGIGSYFDADGKLKYYENETDNYQQDHYQIFYTRQLHKMWMLNTAVHYTYGRGYYEQYKDNQILSKYNLAPFILNTDTLFSSDLIRRKMMKNDFYGAIASISFDNRKKTQIVFGGGWNQYIGHHFGRIIWMQYAGNNSFEPEWYRSKGIKTDANVYIRTNYKITNTVSCFSDIQYRLINYSINGIDDDLRDISQNHQWHFFNPKAGLNFEMAKGYSSWINVAIAHREPNRDNLISADAAKRPTFEKLIDYEAGVKKRGKNEMLSVNLFYMDYKNQLALTGEINTEGEPIMVNVPKSYRFGIETEASWMPIKKLRLDANFTWSRNKIIQFDQYIDDWDTWTQRKFVIKNSDISFSPELTGTFVMSYSPVNQLKIQWLTKYVSKQYIDNSSDDSFSLSAYSYSNLNFSWKFKNKLFSETEFLLAINNVLDAKYETNAWVYKYFENNQLKYMDGYFPQAGLNFLAGLRLRL